MSLRGLAALLALGLTLAASMPVRIRRGLLVFDSFTPLDLVLVAGPILILFFALARRGMVQLGDRWVAAVLALPLGLGLLSVLWTRHVESTLYYCVQSLLALTAYLLTVTLLRGQSSRLIVRLMLLFVSIAVALSTLSFFRVPGFEPATLTVAGTPQATAYQFAYYSRLSHPYWGLSNNLATVLAFFPVLLWAVALQRRSLWPAVVGLAGAIGVVGTLSRGGTGGLLLGLMLFAVTARANRGLLLGGVVALLLLLVPAIAITSEYREALGDIVGDRFSTETIEARLHKHAIGWEKLSASPLLGYGAGVVADDDPELVGGVHDTYLDAMLYFGVPLGLLLDLGLISLVAAPLWGWRRRLPRSPIPEGLAAAFLSLLFIFGVESSFEGPVLRIMFYFSAALGVALLNAAGDEAVGPAAAPSPSPSLLQGTT